MLPLDKQLARTKTNLNFPTSTSTSKISRRKEFSIYDYLRASFCINERSKCYHGLSSELFDEYISSIYPQFHFAIYTPY